MGMVCYCFLYEFVFLSRTLQEWKDEASNVVQKEVIA